jgi:hypothetical protein
LTKAQRVHRHAAEAQLEMQVRSRAPARTPGGSDHLAGPDLVADANAPAGEVRVERGVAPPDGDLDNVAVSLEASLLADRDHPAGLRRPDRERAEDADVDPRVPAARVVAEGRGDRPLRRPGRPRRTGRLRRQGRAGEREGEEECEHE